MSQHIQGDKMTADETAKDYFNGTISAYSVRDLWRRGEIPGVKCGKLIFSRKDLDDWFSKKSRENIEQKASGGQLRVVGQ